MYFRVVLPQSFRCRHLIFCVRTSTYRLVVQCTTERTTTKSVLLTEWRWEEQYHVIDPNTIVGPCFVISIKAFGSKVLETLPFEEWHSQFTETEFGQYRVEFIPLMKSE